MNTLEAVCRFITGLTRWQLFWGLAGFYVCAVAFVSLVVHRHPEDEQLSDEESTHDKNH